jgi:hypothetical protein
MTAHHCAARIHATCAECERPFLAKRESARFCEDEGCVRQRKNRASADARAAKKAAARRADDQT